MKKRCSSCNKIKNISLFVKNRNQCKKCRSKVVKKYTRTPDYYLKRKINAYKLFKGEQSAK